MGKKKVIIIGAGGHAKDVIDILLKDNTVIIKGILDDLYTENQIKDVNKIQFLGKIKDSLNYKECSFIVAIGNNRIRKKISQKYNLDYYTAIHPSAQIAAEVIIGKGSVIMANAVINSNGLIGEHSIISIGAVLGHDCKVENYVHIAPNATLCGDVIIGKESWIGAGSTVIQGLTIKENTVVGAGSVVIKDLPANCTAVGAPAKPIKFHK